MSRAQVRAVLAVADLALADCQKRAYAKGIAHAVEIIRDSMHPDIGGIDRKIREQIIEEIEACKEGKRLNHS